MTSSPPSIRTHLPDYVLLALLLAVLYGILVLLMPFSGHLVAAFVIGIAFYPLHRRIGRWVPKASSNMHALMTNFLVLLFLVVPSVLLIWVTTNEAQSLAPMLQQAQPTIERLRDGQGVESIGFLHQLRVWLSVTIGIQPSQFRTQIVGMTEGLLQGISLGGAALAKNFVSFIIHLLIMLFTLFFVFRDGPKMVHGLQRYTPLPTDLKIEVTRQIQQTVMGVLRGWVLTSLVQGMTAGIGYLIVGMPAVVLLSCLTAMTGLIPSIGTALIWLPIAVVLLIKHAFLKGIFMLAWGTLVVGVVDNFLRPYLIRNRADVPFMALFFGILGGVEVFGTKGFVIGPILFAVAPVVLRKFRERFKPAEEERS